MGAVAIAAMTGRRSCCCVDRKTVETIRTGPEDRGMSSGDEARYNHYSDCGMEGDVMHKLSGPDDGTDGIGPGRSLQTDLR